MSVINRETKKVAAKNIKDDVNNVLKNALSQRGKPVRQKKAEVSNAKEVLETFYNKLVQESLQTNDGDKSQPKLEKITEMARNTNKPKSKETKVGPKKTGKKGGELVIPCTNDLCAKVRQLVQMNAEVQRFRHKFLEPPVEADKRTLHQKKIEIGNMYSKQNLEGSKKPVKATKTAKYCKPGTKKNVGWNPQTLITPEVLGSSSAESLLAITTEVETTSYEPCVEFFENDKFSELPMQSLYRNNFMNSKASGQIDYDTDYATCAEDNQGTEIPARKTTSAKMLAHFRQLLDQHTLQKDKEKVKASVLSDDEVYFLQNLVEADERYRLLQREDHEFLKEVLRHQLRQIEAQERILQEALRKLKEKTGSVESVRSELIALANQSSGVDEMVPDLLSCENFVSATALLDSEKFVIIMSPVDDPATSAKHYGIVSPRSGASSLRSGIDGSVQDTVTAKESCKSPHSLFDDSLKQVSVTTVTQQNIHLTRDMKSHVPSLSSILDTFETTTPRTPPVSPASISVGNASEKWNQTDLVKVQQDLIARPDVLPQQSVPPSVLFLGNTNVQSSEQQNVVPPLNLDDIYLEPALGSRDETKHAYPSPVCKKDNEDKNAGIQVIFKNISSPQKEIQLLKAISARLEKTFEKTESTYSPLKSIEVNLNDDSEMAASALTATRSFPVVKIDDTISKISWDQMFVGEKLDSNKLEDGKYSLTHEFVTPEEEVTPNIAEILEYEFCYKTELLTANIEGYTFFEEYSTSLLKPLNILSIVCIVKVFKVKYLSLDEMKFAEDFYIFRPKSEISEPEKTNFEQLKSNPVELAKLLTPIFEGDELTGVPVKDTNKIEEVTPFQTGALKIPDEAIIKRVICCLFKTWATYPELYIQAISPTIWNSDFEHPYNIRLTAGDCNIANNKLNYLENTKQAITLESSCLPESPSQKGSIGSLSYVECESPHEADESSGENCTCRRHLQHPNNLELLLEHRKQLKNTVVFLAQFVLFVLLVISLSMPDYQCLKF